jgi:hypothetical protein
MGLTASDFIRSMFREGFSRDEIYDVLTGIGLPWQEVQLLIERVEAELREAGFESRPTRLKRVLEEILQETKRELFVRLESLARQLEFLRFELRRRRPTFRK